VPDLLPALDKLLHSGQDIPASVQCVLVQAQLETIRPFLIGSGRVGRLLVAFQLVHHEAATGRFYI